MFLSESRTQTVVNGNVVEDSGFNVEYDGKHLNLGLIDGGEDPVYIKMNNEELDELLKMTEDEKMPSLGERLMSDFSVRKPSLLVLKAGKTKKNKKRRKNKSRRR